jgi:hypothetical protein
MGTIGRVLSLLYFFGLVMFGIAVANLNEVPAYGFMIIGGGIVVYTAIVGVLSYFHKKY